MAHKFRAEGSSGTVAIYEASDDDPFDDPVAHPSRVLFHSGLLYPARIATITGTLSMPARSAPGSAPFTRVNSAGYQLAAHGLAGIPLVEGKLIGIGAGGVDVPWVGSVPLAATGFITVGRWITLGADDTYIYAHEMWGTASGFAPGAQDVDYEIHILDFLFDP